MITTLLQAIIFHYFISVDKQPVLRNISDTGEEISQLPNSVYTTQL